MARNFYVIDGCPVPKDVAPYIDLILRRAGLTASSIYRGNDPEARAIMHRHGKHTQYELWNATPLQRARWGVTGIPNTPGHSAHELASWHVGVDSGPNTDDTRKRILSAAAHYNLHVHFPYNSVVEYHHWEFLKKPTYDGKRLYKTRVLMTRAKLALNR